MTSAVLPLLIFCVSTGVMATLSGTGLRMASKGQAELDLISRLVAAGFGACLLSLPMVLFAGEATTDPVVLLVKAFLGSCLASLTLTDRMTAWAPDTLTFPLVILAIASGAIDGHWGLGLFASLFVGIAIFGTVQIFWALLQRVSGHLPPPPDVYGLFLPILLFGFSLQTVASYLLLSGALLLFKYSSAVRHILSVRKVMEDTALEMHLDQNHGMTVPLLAVLCPVVLLVLGSTSISGGF